MQGLKIEDLKEDTIYKCLLSGRTVLYLGHAELSLELYVETGVSDKVPMMAAYNHKEQSYKHTTPYNGQLIDISEFELKNIMEVIL